MNGVPCIAETVQKVRGRRIGKKYTDVQLGVFVPDYLQGFYVMREVLPVPLRKNLKHAGLIENYLPARISVMDQSTSAETSYQS